MHRYRDNRQEQTYDIATQKLGTRMWKIPVIFTCLLLSILVISVLGVIFAPLLTISSSQHDAGQAEIADKQHLLFDKRVDVVIHVDGVGGYVGDKTDKSQEYDRWVSQDIKKYHNFNYGGFKLFYHIEAKTLMTPKEVLALNPPPMVITYGN